ncbi:Protein N-acetyltransferase, RimJ/RimL family [Salinibacillus kushneri]|uniref:Protein N-acetyltransferase, RimJ/RimL family n=1 Tax=Salinibacillus kushneri TaxID=237682 RepID=A0A1I0G0P5_9BACI|nr:GNAT family protein [Salinibacillus kushneri]SET64388.1 Protein N-acetyltransferase, RimJ/RimL family [Salinibacillus kushneri]
MLKGKRIELRPVTKSDLVNQYKWRNDEEFAYLASGSNFYLYNNTPLETLEAFYEKNLTSVNEQDGCVFSVYTLEDCKHIGKCDYRDVNMVTRTATIGLSIGEKDYWNKGYGTDILKVLIRHLFYNLNLRRIQLDTWSGNERAIRAYQKCGFRIEGRLKENEYVDGHYYDTVIMGLLRSEYS